MLLSGRNPHPSERIIFDFAFMPNKDDSAIAGRNDSDVCGDRYIDLLDKFPALDALMHGFVYDGAADSEVVDRILNRGKHAVVPTRKTSTGNHAAANLGACNFKQADTASSARPNTRRAPSNAPLKSRSGPDSGFDYPQHTHVRVSGQSRTQSRTIAALVAYVRDHKRPQTPRSERCDESSLGGVGTDLA